jgi:hypothetical protein
VNGGCWESSMERGAISMRKVLRLRNVGYRTDLLFVEPNDFPALSGHSNGEKAS